VAPLHLCVKIFNLIISGQFTLYTTISSFICNLKIQMLKPLLLSLLLLQAFLGGAQGREFTGLITSNNERQSSVIIKNISTRTQTKSNDRGEFFIKARPGDTLITIKTDYIPDTLLIADQQYIIVQLHKSPTMLKEVVVNATPLSPESIYAANKKEYKLIYFFGDKSHVITPLMIPGTSMGLGIGVNIDKLNNALGKRGHDARQLQRNLTTDYKNSVIDKRFNPIAARITGYQGKRLSDFIMDNRPSYDFIANATDYDITQYIKRKLSMPKKS
jgi:hypothetical protein